jgi:hypothetical protein
MKIILLMVALFILWLCLPPLDLIREELAPLETKKLAREKPTSQTFDIPIMLLRQRIIDAFSMDNQMNNKKLLDFKLYGRPEHARDAVFTVETIKDSFVGKKVFANGANRNDLYLHLFNDPLVSETYFALGKPLAYSVSFQIHLESNPKNQTIVSVIALDPKVLKGNGGRGTHGYHRKEIAVNPTTIEENRILSYVANQARVEP